MTTNLPAIIEPMTPADCDLRAYEFMPLSVLRLRDSAIISEVSPEGFRSAILLWCASWHQVPAASLPDDDRQLSRLAGYGLMVHAWRAIREEALYGFVKASDGRFYHPVVAEKALESWKKRSAFVARSKAANDAKYGKKTTRKPKPDKAPSYKEAKPRAKDSRSEGNIRKKEGSANALPLVVDEVFDADPIGDGFERWWRVYPTHRAKKESVAAFRVAIKKLKPKGSIADRIQFLIDTAQAQVDHEGPERIQFMKDPHRWLQGERWNDELTPRRPDGPRPAADAPSARRRRSDESLRSFLAGSVAAANRRDD